MVSSPRPGQENTISVTTAPPSNTPRCRPSPATPRTPGSAAVPARNSAWTRPASTRSWRRNPRRCSCAPPRARRAERRCAPRRPAPPPPVAPWPGCAPTAARRWAASNAATCRERDAAGLREIAAAAPTAAGQGRAPGAAPRGRRDGPIRPASPPPDRRARDAAAGTPSSSPPAAPPPRSAIGKECTQACSRAALFRDDDRRARRHAVEERDDIAVAHAHAAARARHAHRHVVGRAVQIDVTPHAVHGAETIAAHFAAAQPEDAGENPVSSRKALAQLAAVDLAGGPAADDHGIRCGAGTDLGADDVCAARRAFAALLLAWTVLGGGNQYVHHWRAPLPITQTLRADIDLDACGCARHSVPPCTVADGAARRTATSPS